MNPAEPMPRAVVLSTFDAADAQQLVVHSCEDCACPVSSDHRTARSVERVDIATSADRWVRGAEVLEMTLDPEHHVLFNPVGNGGVAVVNEPARDVLHRFDEPRTFGDVQGGWPGHAHNLESTLQRLIEIGMVHRWGQPPRHDFQDGTVLTAWLHVTNACNLRCHYCYVNKSNEGMDESVGRAAVDALVRSAVEHDFRTVKLKYAGGEASLNSRLMLALHDYAEVSVGRHDLQLQGVLLSNGVALPPKLIAALSERKIRVMISLDGLGDLHDAQRPTVNGKPSSAFVTRTIDRLIEQDCPPHLSITMTNRNLSGVADVVRFALERNLTFSLNFFRDNDCAAGFSDLRYEEQSMISALLEAFEVIAEFLPPWSVLGSILDRGQLLEPRQRSCGVGQDYVVIDQRGQVSRCHMEIERTLGDVFSADPLQLVRQDGATVQNLLVEEKEGCRECTWRYWCSGGCAVATFRATGRYDVKSPNCNIYKAIYPHALRLEGLRLLKHAPR